jgi:hypothetical protein
MLGDPAWGARYLTHVLDERDHISGTGSEKVPRPRGEERLRGAEHDTAISAK